MADNPLSVAPADVISGLEPSELVEIRRISSFGSRTLVEGIGIQSRREIKRPLTSEEFQTLVKIRGTTYTLKGDSEVFLLPTGSCSSWAISCGGG